MLFNDSVLIGDYRNFTVYKVGLDGNRMAEFPDGSLKSFLAEQKERHDYYAGVSRWLLWLFWGALAVGFLVAVFQGLQSGSVKSLRALGVTAGIDTRNPAIFWISPDPAYRRYLRLSIILFAGMLAVVWMLGLYVGFQSLSKLLFLMALAGVVSIFLFYRITTYRIGVFKDVLILMKGKRYRAGRGEQILYSDSHVVIGNMAMPMGSAVKSFFRKKQMIEHVYPLLKGGTELNRAQLQMLLIRGMDESVIATGLLVVVLILFVVLN